MSSQPLPLPTTPARPMSADTLAGLAPERLRALIAQTESGLLDRSAAVRLALLGALAGEHVLLIGPPGTAKSALARRLQHAFAGARYFERLLTRFSVPDELFGPLSLKALEDDRYERLTEGYLPTAGIAFLDEVFKANSAILNALLTLLNEREFDNGVARIHTPLVCVVGATNEVPNDEALHAFYDRFLLRVPVQPLGDADFEGLLTLAPDKDAAAEPTPTQALAAAERERLAEAGRAVGLGDVLDLLHAARRMARGLSLQVSDRRWRQTVGLLRTAAASSGRTAVSRLDLWVLPYCLADRPEQVPSLAAWVEEHALDARALTLPWLTRGVEAFEGQLGLETTPRQDDGTAGKLALAKTLGGTLAGPEGTGMPRLLSAALEDDLRPKFSPLHIAARVAQVDELRGHLTGPLPALRERAVAMQAALAQTPWLPPALAAQITAAHASSVHAVEELLARIDAVRAGFAALPVDPALADTAPRPVSWPDAQAA